MNKEKISSLVQLGSTPVTLLAFLIFISPNFGTDIESYDFGWPILWSILIGLGTSITLSIVLSAIFQKDLKDEIKDERDIKIHRNGEYYTQGFYIAGGLSALLLAIFEFEYFWIALAVFVFFNLANFSASIAKLLMYRFGVS
jgi:hypothetical protein